MFIFLYADDAKIFMTAECEVNREALQRGLDQLADWAKKWQLRVNIENNEKCKTIISDESERGE